MHTVTEIQTLDQLLDPLRDCLTKDVALRIAGLRADASVQAKLDDYAERHHEGQLSADELAEYTSLISAGNLVAVLQAKARSALSAG